MDSMKKWLWGTDAKDQASSTQPKRSASHEQLIGLGLSTQEYQQRKDQPEHPKHSEIDKGESQDSNESQVKNLIKEFRQTGGNTSLEHAKIICLGDLHTDERHHKLNAQLIDIVAKDGDIILLEGEPAHQEYTQADIQEDARTRPISKKVRVFGWDNIKLKDTAIDIARERQSILNTIENGNLSQEKCNKLQHKRKDLYKELLSIAVIERNKTLAEVIEHKSKEFPNSKIFALAGRQHFISDDEFTRYLGTKPYISFEPAVTLSDKEKKERKRQYYSAPSQEQQTSSENT
jgi:hypothetical protein